jgi:hypothetical protein
MKPLVRWTIGNVNKTGHEILKKSIRSFKKLYPNFDYIVCYNEIKYNDSDKIEGIEYFSQSHECCDIPVKPFSINAWKLFPPRLRINSYELFLDNDLVIHKKIPQIDEFLNNDRPLCYGTHDKHRDFPYGRFSNFFSKNENNFILNSGIFGLPPGYDFEKEIIYFINKISLKKWEYFDEQGLVAKCLLNKKPIFINANEISNCWMDYKHGEYGCHFCEHNTKNLTAWKKYKKQKKFL